MPYNFCTLFDRNYATRGLALYASLMQHAGDFTLWILCMDDQVFQALTKLQLPKTQLVRLADLEDDELRQVKTTRSPVEYCWTLTPSLPLYILTQHPELEHITYLDADTYFFSSPQPIYDEWVGKSILIVSHNYAPRYVYKIPESGIYNVEFLIFRNDANGLACLRWWRERCNEWCYFRLEDGKLGDQMYLNDWTTRFSGVQVLQHLGGGVAPWNIERFHFSQREGQVKIDQLPVIFYHYHALRWYGGRHYDPALGYWYLPSRVRHFIYKPYIRALSTSYRQLQTVDATIPAGIIKVAFQQRLLRAILLPIVNSFPFNLLYQRWHNQAGVLSNG